ncbi:MAG TPA: hypothetical protein VF669_18260 [Tepidisphaeraceae bacterium]
MTQVKFQNRVDGWLLDDLLLTMINADGPWRCAMSVKSNAQFNADHAAPADFVRDSWEQLLGGAPMDPLRDRLALAVSGVPAAVMDDFHTLRDLAEAAEPGSLEDRLRVKGFVDEGKRKMAASFACPSDLAAAHPGPVVQDAASVIAKIHVLDFDFPSATSRSRREAIQMCGQALRHSSPEDAARLWQDLCALAREVRPKAGMLDIPRLVGRLRSRHDLAVYPNHRADWERLNQYTSAQLDAASRWTLGARLSLTRFALRQQIDEAVADMARAGAAPAIPMLIGRSGDGKSVLARQWIALGLPKLWLDARLFEAAHGQDPMTAAEQRLNLKTSLRELIRSAAGKRPRLVLDGVSRLFDELALNALAMLSRDAAAAGWEVVATCQDDDLERVARVFKSAQLNLSAVQVGPLTDEELREVGSAEMRLRPFLAKDELKRVLARPKYLDVVLRSVSPNDVNPIPDSERWIGEAHLAEWCWRQAVEGISPRTARAAAAKQMASKQADAVRDSVSDDELVAAHLPAIDELLTEGVCRKVGERLVFDHDLLGDWGRQRVLLGQADIVGFMTVESRGASPLWLRGLRLWALDVLERQGDYAKWISTVRELTSAGEVAAADRVLEAVALSTRAFEHLEKAWVELSGDGELLRRLLERFLRAATSPNRLAIQALAKLPNDAGKDLVTWAASEYRVPEWPHWPAMLVFLHRHRNDVARLAPGEAARVARLWLTSTASDVPFRTQAAEIALAAAEHVHQVMDDRKRRRHWSEGLDHWSLCNEAEAHVYAAVLIAAAVLPSEVAEFARHAAGRSTRPPSGQVEEEPGVVYAAPWADGPSDRVSDEFRKSVLNVENFIPLATTAPDAAKEVLLAVLINPPDLIAHPGMLGIGYDDDREFSIEHVFGWSPPFYVRGPFLEFLRAAPTTAIDAIVRLVNFATARWSDRETRDIHHLRGNAGPPRTVKVYLDDNESSAEWHGDIDVYSWYLGDPRAPDPVTSALMALEKWFYDQLEGGNDISAAIDQIKHGSQSVAFAGLLSAVGRYRPELFKGPLAFLTSTPEFMYWESHPEQEITGTALLSWQMFPVRGTHVIEPAQKWYAMPHRRNDLFTIAKFHFLNDLDFRKMQSARVDAWREQLKGDLHADDANAIRDCVRAFDIDQWEVIDLPNGQKAWQPRLSQEERQETSQAIQEAHDQLKIISFPHRCRELLNREQQMTLDELEQFWKDLQLVAVHLNNEQQLERSSAECGQTDRPDVMAVEREAARSRGLLDGAMGGIAVLLLRYGDWLNRDRARKAWVLRQLRRIPQLRVRRGGIDGWHPDEHNDDRWECFFAAVVIDFLRRKPGSSTWRYYAASLTTGFHHSPVRHLFAAAFRHRADLQGTFEELLHLLFRWSATRWHAEHQRNGWKINVDVQAEWHRAMDDFLSGRLTGPLPAFADLAATPVEQPDKPILPECFRRGLDLPVIAAALHSIMRPKDAHDDEERARWLLFWRDLFAWRLAPTPDAKIEQENQDHDRADDDERWPRNKLPYPSDRWLLNRVADLLLQLRPTEDHRQFWQPVLDLVPALHAWTEEFLTSLFIAVLRADPTPPAFGSIWMAMLQYASGAPQWAKADDGTWAHLLGFDHLLHDLWEKRHSPLLMLARPFLEMFVRTKLQWRFRLGELLGLLKTPAAEEIRLQLLPIIATVAKEQPNLLRDDDEQTAAARFLDFCWQHQHAAITGNTECFDAFSQLLGMLVGLQVPLAFEIQERLRRG